MGLVTRTTGVGLVLAEHSQDEAGVKRALQQIDDRLVLQKHPAAVPGGWVYKVFRLVSDDTPPDLVCAWADEYGNPLPLTSGLVDKVNSLRRDAPGKGVSVDEHNAAHVERARRIGRESAERVIEDHFAYVERGRHSVSMSGSRKRNRVPR